MVKFDPLNPFGKEGMLAVLVRLANENDQSWRFTRKGDKRMHADVEKGRQANLKRLAEKRDKAAARLEAARLAKFKARQPEAGQSIADQMLRAMEPGGWYGQGDLVRLIGAGRAERAKVHQVLLKRGWIEKARNPRWCGERPSPDEIEAGAEPEPQHLYRLTERGLRRRSGLDKMNEPV